MKKLLLALVAVATAASAFAQASAVPNLISYQSRVADAAGVPLGNTTPVNRIVIFRIWDSPSASAAANRLYSEQQTVTISGGEFSVLIGSGTAISTESSNAFSTLSSAVFGGATRYLGVTIDDGDGNPFNDPEMSPRQQIVGTAFAFRSAVAESVAAGGVSATALANGSVGTAALAAGGITSDKLAAGAIGATQIAAGSVGTGQLADASLTLAKHAPDSIDSSKIIDGSIGLADLNASVRAAMPKPKAIYNQGMGSSGGMSCIIFPIDIGDLGNDADGCVLSYFGQLRSGANTAISPQAFSGTIRIVFSPFLTTGTFSTNQSTVAATLGEASNPSLTVQHSAYFGIVQTTSPLAGTPAFSPPFTPTGAITTPDTLGYFWYSGQNRGGVNSTIPSMWPVAWVDLTQTANSTPWGVLQIFTYYPGILLNSNNSPGNPAVAPYNTVQQNISTNANAGGPPRTQGIVSVAASTNKLTVTLDNPHAIQVGDTVTLAGVTGTPAANGTFTVTAQPDRMSFEVALTGATGTYTGGTVTYTPKYNKYRLWAAVHSSAAIRISVSDN